jgi:hypothetical protein
MFGPIGGLAGNLVVGPAQLLLAAAEPGLIWRQGWRKWFHIRHVGVLTSPTTMVQAMPRGAEEIELTAKHWTKDYVYIRPAYTDRFSTGPDQGLRVAKAARGYVGTPYNFATYAAIPAHRAGIPIPHLDRYISSRKDMMCSQLADQCLADAGWHVFEDGRLPQDVTPSELFRKMLVMPTEMILRPA